MNNLS